MFEKIEVIKTTTKWEEHQDGIVYARKGEFAMRLAGRRSRSR
jgi:hypothetical protein